MINKKSIIILTAVVIVLLCAFLTVNFFWKESVEEPVSFESTSIEFFTTANENIIKMDITVDGESFSFVRSGEKWLLAGNEDVNLKNSSVDYLCSELAGIYAKQCVDEKGENLSAYGFDNPFGRYTITLSDGTAKTFLLGKQDPVTGVYFFKDASEMAVYTIYQTKGDALCRNVDTYKNSDIIGVDIGNLSKIEVTSSKTVLELVSGTTDDGTVEWKMKKPMIRDTDLERINESVLSKLSYISVSEFIDEKSEKYAQSGVNNPEAVLTLTDGEGVSQKFYIGKSVDQQRYVKTNGRVYLINGEGVSFVDLDPFIYINKFISLEDIDEVSKIEVISKGKTHTATITGENENYTYKLNGTEVMETNFKRQVYQKIIALMADDFALNPKYSTPEYTVIFYFRDGTVKKNEYCHYDDRNYAVYNSNGTCEFILRKKKLNEMFDSLENVVAQRQQ